MKLLWMALCFISTSVFANIKTYDLKMDLAMDGKHLVSPRVVVLSGKKATITQETTTHATFVDVLASDNDEFIKDGIMLELIVGSLGPGGKRTIYSKAKVAVKENELARFTAGNLNGPEELTLTILAKRDLRP